MYGYYGIHRLLWLSLFLLGWVGGRVSLGTCAFSHGKQVVCACDFYRRLQLVGVTGMFVAAKFEEIDPPRATDFVYITDNTYSKAGCGA